MEKTINLLTAPLCCQVADSYCKTRNFKQTGQAFKLETEEVKRLIIKHLGHTHVTSNSHQVGTEEHEEPAKAFKQ